MKTNSYTGRAKRTDANHAEVRDKLREAGYSVEDLSGSGDGCPDLLVGVTVAGSPWNFLFEVKVAGTGRPTPKQVSWHDNWQGQVAVIHCVDDAIRIIERRRATEEETK